MSSEALAWAFRQTVKSSSVKFTLVALCECANYRTGRITPSIAHLTEITGQNRKTIIANIAELERAGIISDTGDRVGRTGQIKVYLAEMGTVPKTEQSQKRNSSENGRKESQKRDTEPSLEPSSPSVSTKPSESGARETFPCPDGCDQIDWNGLLQTRKANRKPMTAGAYRQILNKLDRWSRDGWPPGPILANAAERGWLTVFPTDEMKSHDKPNPPRGNRDGVAAALDRRLGQPSRETGRPAIGDGRGDGGGTVAYLAAMR